MVQLQFANKGQIKATLGEEEATTEQKFFTDAGPAGPFLEVPGAKTHLSWELNAWVTVGKVLPEQQSVLILLPC